jgi:hypothetical protein
LLLAIGWELALALLLVQFSAVREAFGISMPGTTDVAMIIGFGVIVATSIEMVKTLLRSKVAIPVRNAQ